MRERGIIFTGESVRAILDGRKTQTRRVVKVPRWIAEEDAHDYAEIAWVTDGHSGSGFYGWNNEYVDEGSLLIPCPYGVPGDELWVREAWQPYIDETPDTGLLCCIRFKDGFMFKPDGLDEEKGYQFQSWCECGANNGYPWHSPIFMPRWASRLTLEVEEVRVQRVQEISEEDAAAEGVPTRTYCDGRGFEPATVGFRALWDSINAKRGFSWESNPWVWALAFRRLP